MLKYLQFYTAISFDFLVYTVVRAVTANYFFKQGQRFNWSSTECGSYLAFSQKS